jgi:outer membrane lipoprotein SlyB
MSTEPAFRSHNVVAVFENMQSARSAMEAAKQAGADESRIRLNDRNDEVASLRGEMRQQSEETFVGPGNVGPFTDEQTKGLTFGTAIATPIGAVIGLLIGLIPMGWLFGDLDLGLRLLIGAAVGAVAGATVGFTAGGGVRPFMEGDDALAAEKGVTLGFTSNDPEEAARIADALRRTEGASRVDLVGPSGEALGA